MIKEAVFNLLILVQLKTLDRSLQTDVTRNLRSDEFFMSNLKM